MQTLYFPRLNTRQMEATMGALLAYIGENPTASRVADALEADTILSETRPYPGTVGMDALTGAELDAIETALTLYSGYIEQLKRRGCADEQHMKHAEILPDAARKIRKLKEE